MTKKQNESDLTLPEALADYLERHPGFTPNHARKLQESVKRWESLMGRCPIGKINREMVLAFGSEMLAKGFSTTTLDFYRRAVVRIVDDFETVPRLGGKRTSESNAARVPGLEQLGHMWHETRRMTWPFIPAGPGSPCWLGVPPAVWWRAVLTISFSTAMSRNDLFNLRWGDIGTDRIRIRFGQQGKSVYHPIPEPARPWLTVLRTLETETLFAVPAYSSLSPHINAMARPSDWGASETAEVRVDLAAIRHAAIAAYETACPGAARLFSQKNLVAQNTRSRFEMLQAASRNLVYPPGFLEPPPAIYLAPASLPAIAPPAVISRPNRPQRRRRRATSHRFR